MVFLFFFFIKSSTLFTVFLVLRKIWTNVGYFTSYFDGASGTLIWAAGDSPFLSPGCAVIPQIWTFCSCCKAGREPLHCVCCCSETAGFSAWRFTVTWTTTRTPKLFSFCYCTLPGSLVSSCKRGTQSCWLYVVKHFMMLPLHLLFC